MTNPTLHLASDSMELPACRRRLMLRRTPAIAPNSVGMGCADHPIRIFTQAVPDVPQVVRHSQPEPKPRSIPRREARQLEEVGPYASNASLSREGRLEAKFANDACSFESVILTWVTIWIRKEPWPLADNLSKALTVLLDLAARLYLANSRQYRMRNRV